MGLSESKQSRKSRMKTVDFPRIEKETKSYRSGSSDIQTGYLRGGESSNGNGNGRYPPIIPPRSSSFSDSTSSRYAARHQAESPPIESKGTMRSCLQWDSTSRYRPQPANRPPLTVVGGKYPKGTCDKCDGCHLTDDCPIYRKKRDDHPDAWRNFGRKNPLEMGKGGGNFRLRSARIVRQPGDGSCLFHSLAYGLGGTSASSLRREIAGFIQRNPELEIAETPMKDWVKWDSGCSVSQYASRMAVSGWGGGIEMAACSHIRKVNVHVYEKERLGGGFKRISCFDVDGARDTVHVLYQGGVHFDALEP